MVHCCGISSPGPSQRVSFLSVIENLEVIPGEPQAKVVVNSRTGTVVTVGRSE